MRKTLRHWFDVKFPNWNNVTYEVRPKGSKWIAVRIGDDFTKVLHSYASGKYYYWSTNKENADSFDTVEEAKKQIMRSIWKEGHRIKEETREKEVEATRTAITIPPWNS